MLSQQKDLSIAIIFSVITAIAFAIGGALVKLLTVSVPPSIIVFFRFFVGIVFLLPIMAFYGSKGTFSLKTNQPGLHAIRGFSALIALSCFYTAIKYIPLVNAVLFINTFPLFMPLLVWAVLRITTSFRLLVAIVVGFVGVIFVLKPGHVSFQWYTIVALLSGIFATVSIFTTRQLNKTEKKLTILFYYFLIAFVVSGIVAIFRWKAISAYDLWLMLLVGVITTIYQASLTYALSKAPARVVSPLMYLSLLFSGLLDWYYWGHTPGLLATIGMIIVIISAFFVILFSRDQKASQRKLK